MQPQTESARNDFVERRQTVSGDGPRDAERRQFVNSYGDLSPAARELAVAIDTYKFQHRRRFISYEEILSIVLALGYSKDSQPASHGPVRE